MKLNLNLCYYFMFVILKLIFKIMIKVCTLCIYFVRSHFCLKSISFNFSLIFFVVCCGRNYDYHWLHFSLQHRWISWIFVSIFKYLYYFDQVMGGQKEYIVVEASFLYWYLFKMGLFGVPLVWLIIYWLLSDQSNKCQWSWGLELFDATKNSQQLSGSQSSLHFLDSK